MTMSDFWNLVTTAQVSTALVIIAISLGVIAIKLTEKKSSKKSDH